MMAASCPFCPPCGASQDEQSRRQGALRNRDALLVIGPSSAGVLLGWFLLGTVAAAAGGLAVGLLAGIGLVAPIYSQRGEC
jgi:hypothetical protein